MFIFLLTCLLFPLSSIISIYTAQIEEEGQESYNYQYVIGALFRNEQRILEQFIEHHLMLGFEKFYMVNNNSTDKSVEVLQPYIDAGIVELYNIDYEGIDVESFVRDLQVPANNLALKRAKEDKVKWLLILDVDEFLSINTKNPFNINSLLDQFEEDNTIAIIHIPRYHVSEDARSYVDVNKKEIFYANANSLLWNNGFKINQDTYFEGRSFCRPEKTELFINWSSPEPKPCKSFIDLNKKNILHFKKCWNVSTIPLSNIANRNIASIVHLAMKDIYEMISVKLIRHNNWLNNQLNENELIKKAINHHKRQFNNLNLMSKYVAELQKRLKSKILYKKDEHFYQIALEVEKQLLIKEKKTKKKIKQCLQY